MKNMPKLYDRYSELVKELKAEESANVKSKSSAKPQAAAKRKNNS